MINRFVPLSLKWNSLFVRLLSSFLLLIVLLLSFNLFSFTFFKTNVHRDIVSYNMLGLAKSVDSYEKHFNLIEFNLMQLGMSRPVTALGKSSDVYDYTLAAQAIEQMKTLTGNPLLFLNNIVIYNPDRSYFLEKTGPAACRICSRSNTRAIVTVRISGRNNGRAAVQPSACSLRPAFIPLRRSTASPIKECCSLS